MVVKEIIRYASDGVGRTPSAMGCEARRRGLERIHF